MGTEGGLVVKQVGAAVASGAAVILVSASKWNHIKSALENLVFFTCKGT